MYALRRGSSRRSINIWPGFVDGLSNLLLVVIFVLMVFMVAQFFLSVAISGKDQALTRLESEIAQLAELLALERTANTELRLNVEQLSSELQSSLASRESLAGQLAALSEERESLANQLAALADERDRLAAMVDEERSERERLGNLLGSSEETLAETRAELQESRQALAERQNELDDARNRLNAALARIEVEQEKLEEALAAIAAGKAELEDAYATIEADKEKIEAQLAELAILKSLRDDLVKRLEDSEGALAEQRELSDEAQLQVTLLNRQLAALREQLARVSEALELAETKNEEQEVQIADLGKRLNVALASKVQELARYRSEFFGRLREILGNRQDIRIVGDRFVFQSEILFDSGSATINPDGRPQLARLADTLKQIASEIPDDLEWVLRVDGHTDRQPINTLAFPSNWELSTARAVSVVKFLVEQGIPADRLAATGFGEYQPLETGGDEIAYRRNRRIEFKLTER
ncbi:MAG TPA: peptidoglycan -binding protein [Kiloniellaceae bacterium]|nr:peptidoglycan -binding protein [Kiloniellaceae bacterium]